MAFFEKIGKHITDTSQNVAQQAKNLADVTQLNSSISDKKRQITQLYTEIGQSYFARHKDDADAEEQQKIDAINALNAEIDQCSEKIKQIKGIGKCANCGADVPAQAQFCTACGAPVQKAAPVAAVEVETAHAAVCPVCNTPVVEGNLFCVHCGTKLG